MISPKKPTLLSGSSTNNPLKAPPYSINSSPKSAPWTRLPFELISIIISYADDPSTVRNWHVAALHNRNLYNAVVLHQWAQITITAHDLLPSPLEKLNRPERRAQTSVIQTATTRAPHNIYPAHHIRDLTIDLNNTRLRHADRLSGPLATGESLEYSLDRLFPHLRSIRRINILGDAPQELIDSIVRSIPRNKITSLKIRLERDDPGRFSTVGRRGKCQQTILHLEKLGQLKGLQELEVWGLKQEEAPKLAQALGQMTNLRRLAVGTDSTWDCMLLPGGNVNSPLDTFFEHVFQGSGRFSLNAETYCGFPTTLKSLELHDYYCSSSQSIQSAPTDPASTLNALNYTYLDLDNFDNIHKLSKWLSGARLSRLVLPGAFCSNRCRSLFLRSNCDPDPAFISNLNPLISTHQSNLSEILLIDAWDTHQLLAHDLNTTWAGKFAIQELVLGTKSPDFYELGPCGVRANWQLDGTNTIQNNLYGYLTPEAIGRWGSELRRVRLDQVSLTGLQVSGLASTHLAHLCVLVISQTSSSNPSVVHAKNTILPYAISTLPEARLAARIAAQDLPKLRLLVVGPYQFWIQRFRPKPTSTIPRHKLWHVIHARADTTQNLRMRMLLNDRDWDFVSGGMMDVVKRKSLDGEIRSGSRGCKMPVSGNISAIELREKNFMVLQKIS